MQGLVATEKDNDKLLENGRDIARGLWEQLRDQAGENDSLGGIRGTVFFLPLRARHGWPVARLSGRRWHGRSDTAADIGIESILSGSAGRVGAGRTSTLSTRTTSQARCRRHKNADTLRRTGIPSTPLTSSGWAELERLRPRLRAAYSNKRVGKSALAKARSWHWHQPNATQRNATQRNASPPPPPLRFWLPAWNRTRDCRSNSLPRYPLDHNDTVCQSVTGIGIYCLGWVLWLACL